MKTVNRYYIMRHGQSTANRDGVICSAPVSGVDSCGLTEEGRARVRQSAGGLSVLDKTTIIYTSDFLRARQTAEEVSAVTGARDIFLSPLLRERFFGVFESLDQRYYHSVWEDDRGNPHNRKNGVESPDEVRARVWELIEQCEKAHKGRTILLISHGDTLQILYAVWKGLSPDRHREIPPIKNCDIIPLD